MSHVIITAVTASSSLVRGRCLCGAVVVELSPPLEGAAHCHCESCRRAHAAPLVTWTSLPAERFGMVSGEPELVRYRSSPGTYRCFCGRCGTSMMAYYTTESPTFASEAGRIYVPLAVLIAPPELAVGCHLSYEERVPWFECGDDLPKFRAKTEEPIL